MNRMIASALITNIEAIKYSRNSASLILVCSEYTQIATCLLYRVTHKGCDCKDHWKLIKCDDPKA